ncbi:MAG: hypothetical protein E6Q50_13425 [Lysobacter sp.]|nr:MAG: hypothetical protein E6Q50_13425 [Lysobacter sp.]
MNAADPSSSRNDSDAPSTLDAETRALCATQARWLEACAIFGGIGLFAAGLAALCLATGAGYDLLRALACVAVALLPFERFLALRLRFDRGLFADLAAARIADLPTLDRALAASGLRRASAGPTRTLADRVRGTRRLWRAHAAVATAQLLLSLAAAALRI